MGNSGNSCPEGGKKRKSSLLRTVLIILAAAILAYSIVRLGTYGYRIWKAENEARQLKELTQKNSGEYQALISEANAMESLQSGELSEDESGAVTVDIQEKLRKAMHARYGSLYEQNRDFAGWLTIEGTNVDYPVMYTPDDPQHYLHTSFDGSYSIAGTLFIDSRCSMTPGDISTNTIIYGHRMSSGTMFGSFGLFLENKDGYVEAHRKVRFDTLDRPGSYLIFAVFLSEIYEADDTEHFRYLDLTEAGDETELEEYLANIKAISAYYDEENEPEFGDEFLTLSTCSYHTEDGRLVILAKRTGW